VKTSTTAQLGLRQRRVRDTRRRILAAARELFGEEGFHRASLEDIAARAEVVRPTIYRHFGSKLGLFQALVSDAEERAGIERVFAAMELSDAAEAVRAMLSELCRFWAAEEQLFHQVVGLAAVDPEARQVIEGKDASRRRDMKRLAERLQRQGALQTGWSPQRAGEALWFLTSFITFDHLHRRSGLSRRALERTLHELASAFVADLR
jgi:AcrR family transcriptional regulator